MDNILLFIGFIWLLWDLPMFEQAYHIAVTPCDVLIAQGLASDLYECDILKTTVGNILFILYLLIVAPAFDVFIYLMFVMKFSSPFLTRSGEHLVVIIDTAKVHFFRLKEYKPIFQYKNKLYFLGNGIQGSYNNVYHIFHIGNNQELQAQERNSNKLKLLQQGALMKGYVFKPTFFNQIKFLIRLREQLKTKWEMHIYHDYVEITPSTKRGFYKFSFIKSMNIFLHISPKGTYKFNEIDTGTITVEKLALEEKAKQEQLVCNVQNIAFDMDENFSSILAYTIFKQIKTTYKMLKSITSPTLGGVWLWVLIAGAAAVAIMFFMQGG